MTDEKKSIKSMFTKKLITTIGVIVTLIALIGGIWGFKDTFATNERVNEVELDAENENDELEIVIAGVIQNQQYKSDARYWQTQYDSLTFQINEVKRQIRRYPDDPILREDYRDLIERRKDVKTKWHESMEKIK